MNPCTQSKRLLAAAALTCTVALAVSAAPKPGGTVYVKQSTAELRLAPNPTSDVAATVGFATPLKITEINPTGRWYNVSATAGSGWVFFGLVTESRPETEKTSGIGSVDSSSSTTAAAARPISPEATAYAERHNMVDAGKDVDWVEAEAHKVTAAIVSDYMKEHKKGEFQE
jgi:hypothetical protein